MWVGVQQTAWGDTDLKEQERTPDLGALRNQLADRLEAHPPECWSGPFIVALMGIFDGHALSCPSEPPKPDLRLVR
jgi:hypothetical protein